MLRGYREQYDLKGLLDLKLLVALVYEDWSY